MAAVVNNYLCVLAGNVLAGVLSFLISVLLSRAMTVVDFGVYSLFFAVLVLAWQIPSFIDSSYIRNARASDTDMAREYLKVGLVFKVRAAALMAAAAPVVGWGLSRFAFAGKAGPGILAMAVGGGAFLTFLTSVMANLQVRERFILYSLGNVSYYALLLAVLGPLSRLGPLAPPAVAAVFLSAAAAAGTAAFLVLRRRAGRLAPLDRRAVSGMVAIGRWILPAMLLFIVLQRIDMLLAGRFFPAEMMGVYAAASRLLSILTMCVGAAVSILLPRAAAAARSRAAERTFWREAVFLVSAVLLAIAVLTAAAPVIVSLFYGGRFAGAGGAARLLFLGQIPYVLALPFVYSLYGRGHTFPNFAAMAACFAVNVAANVVLLPRLGLTGPGWAYGAGYSAYLGAILIFFFRRRRGPGFRSRDPQRSA